MFKNHALKSEFWGPIWNISDIGPENICKEINGYLKDHGAYRYSLYRMILNFCPGFRGL
jgi:hypothetical protein